MEFLKVQILGNTMQDYLVSLGIFILTILGAMVANRFLKEQVRNWAKKSATELDDLIVTRIFTPMTYFIIIIGITFAKNYLKLADQVSFWTDKILLILGLMVFFFILIRFFQGLVEIVANGYIKRVEENRPDELEEQKRTVERIKKQVREISNMIFTLIAILTILSNVGVNLKAIWASLGIGGIALVVAVKEPLSNMVGRIYIFSTGIFDEGHFIVFNNWAGTVKRIAMFRTYLELFSDMTTVSIPNADFVKGVVKSYYGRKKFMYKWDLDVPYDVSPQRIQELIKKLRELLHGKPEVNRDMCWIYLERLDRYSKVVRVWIQVRLSDWSASLFYGNQLLHDIQLLFESVGIEFAFPTQTLNMKTETAFRGKDSQDPLPVFLPELDEEGPSE